MRKKVGITYNPWFHIPFILWVIVGGILLQVFNKQQLFAAVNMHYCAAADVLMYSVTFMGQPEVILPALVALMLLPAFRTKWYFITALSTNIIPFLMQQWLKRMFHHQRPLKYFNNAAWIHYLPQWPELNQLSFPSGHSQGAFSFFCFIALLLPAKYHVLGLISFLLALLVCYSRLYLAAHFFEDVYTGSIIGATATTLLYSVMETLKPAIK